MVFTSAIDDNCIRFAPKYPIVLINTHINCLFPFIGQQYIWYIIPLITYSRFRDLLDASAGKKASVHVGYISLETHVHVFANGEY